ncbi:MAG TPA: hypothetical protein VFP32_02335 [Candidatus Saccharimonadales bacterium]|nr:hypothetical protein [Candidatus Saccharimonadales bacterium]
MAEDSEDKVKVQLEIPREEVDLHIDHEAKEKKASEEKESEDEEDSDEDKSESSDKHQDTKIAGYKAGEIAKAPVEPPEPENKAGPNKRQRRVLIFGFIAVAIGALLWPIFNFLTGMLIAACGAVAISYGVLVRA